MGLNAARITKSEFEKALQIPEVQDLLKQWEQGYNVALIQGIPAFVVNGKYLIYTKSIKSLQDLNNKIKELLAK